MRNKRTNVGVQIQRHPNGVICIEQDSINGFDISYNPDDELWYVYDRDEYGDYRTRARFAGNTKGFTNAHYWARTNKPNNT